MLPWPPAKPFFSFIEHSGRHQTAGSGRQATAGLHGIHVVTAVPAMPAAYIALIMIDGQQYRERLFDLLHLHSGAHRKLELYGAGHLES